MIEFQLTTWDRVVLKNILQGYARQHFSLGEVRIGLVVLDALDFTDEEKETIHLKNQNEICRACGTILPEGVFKWDTEDTPVWTLELPKEHLTWFLTIALNSKYPMDSQSLALEDNLKKVLAEIGEQTEK